MTSKIKTYPYDSFANALNTSIENKGGWTGPDDLDLGPCCPPISWHLSKAGLAHHKERGRGLIQTVFHAAFLVGFHNGKAERQDEIDRLERHIKTLTRINDILESKRPPTPPPSEETKARIQELWKDVISKETGDRTIDTD